MKQSVVHTILSYVQDAASEVTAATPMAHEHAEKLATKHHKGLAHKALISAIKNGDKKAVNEHFKAAKQHILDKMTAHNAKKPTEIKPKANHMPRVPATSKEGKTRHTKFMSLVREHPAYHEGLKGRKNKHAIGSLAHRAHELGRAHRK